MRTGELRNTDSMLNPINEKSPCYTCRWLGKAILYDEINKEAFLGELCSPSGKKVAYGWCSKHIFKECSAKNYYAWEANQ